MKLKEKLMGFGIYFLAGTVFLASRYTARNFPIEALNFSQSNAEIVSYEIPTTGNVVSIDRSKSKVDSILNEDGSVTYRGNISYCEKSEGRNYYCDVRQGSVTIKSKEQN